MVNKTTSFKKRAKGKKGNFKYNGKKVVTPMKKPKAGPKPKTSASTAKEMVTGSGTAPRYLADKKDGKVNKGIFDIHIIDVYFTIVYRNPYVFDTS